MSTSASTIERDAEGRFVPGQSGNPTGKRPGTRNRASRLRELLTEGEDREIGRVLIDKAKTGDAVAARFVIGHLYPRPRARTIALDVAEGLSCTNVVAAHDAVLRALFAGDIAPDEAEAVTRVLDARMRALQAHGREESERKWNPDFPTMQPRQAPMPWDEDEDDDVEEDGEEPASVGAPTGPSPADDRQCGTNPHPDPLPGGEGGDPESGDSRPDAQREPSPFGRGQGEGASPVNDLHLGTNPHPDPLPEGEGVDPGSSDTRPDAQTEPSPLGRGQGEGVPPPTPLHSACIQPSPATIAGRRRVAALALQHWAREMTR